MSNPSLRLRALDVARSKPERKCKLPRTAVSACKFAVNVEQAVSFLYSVYLK